MTDPFLQMQLPGFMLVATWLILFWNQFRRITRVHEQRDLEKIAKYSRLKRVGGVYWVLFSVLGIMTIIYAVLPDLYFIFFPLDSFHHPLINTIGLWILKISMVWIIVAQLQIDKELYKYARNIESLSAMELVRYSEKMLLSGMLVLFVGFFITITNLIGLAVVILGSIIYLRSFKLTSLSGHGRG